jgi:hypothetical protein
MGCSDMVEQLVRTAWTGTASCRSRMAVDSINVIRSELSTWIVFLHVRLVVEQFATLPSTIKQDNAVSTDTRLIN